MQKSATMRGLGLRGCGVLALISLVLMSPVAALQQVEAVPNAAVIPLPRTDPGILERQAEVIRRAKESPEAPIVFVGDSITQGWEGDGDAIWRERFAKLGALNLGVSGDRTEHVLWRLQEAPLARLQPRAVVLLIGTNNLGHGTSNAQQTLQGVKAVIAVICKQVPGASVIVCSVFPRGAEMNAMRGDVLQVNQALAAHCAGEAHVRVVDLGTKFVGGDGQIPAALMPDGLHLSARGYAVWADGIAAELDRALKR